MRGSELRLNSSRRSLFVVGAVEWNRLSNLRFCSPNVWVGHDLGQRQQTVTSWSVQHGRSKKGRRAGANSQRDGLLDPAKFRVTETGWSPGSQRAKLRSRPSASSSSNADGLNSDR